MWVMTFHSACVRILRREAKRFGYPSSFSIYDQADSQRLMALVCRELELDAKQFPPKAMAAAGLESQERADRLRDVRRAGPDGYREKALAEAYREYQRRLVRGRRDGLRRPDHGHRQPASRRSPRWREEYRRRFRHVLVDEYQDTNHAQYVLIRELVSAGTPLFSPNRP
jgi:DNA helicase-2/ATP-dependent DNA helicase PcrA